MITTGLVSMVLPCLAAGSGSSRVAARRRSCPLPPRVTVAHPEVRELVDEDDYNGWLQASQTVDLVARVRGHIQKIYFKDGDMVTQDQLLIDSIRGPFRRRWTSCSPRPRPSTRNGSPPRRTSSAPPSWSRPRRFRTGARADRGRRPGAEGRVPRQDGRSGPDKVGPRILRGSPPRSADGSAGPMLTEGNLVNAGGSDPVLTTIVDSRSDLRLLQHRRTGLPALPEEASRRPTGKRSRCRCGN